jgi:6-pyruvoyl-tetrahydropterin synthase related domain
MSPQRLRSLLCAAIDFGAVAVAVGFVASYFPASIMFDPTTTNGGDMGSHYYPAYYLREVLLPRWQLMGWCPGNYAGYPFFQFYFPLSFVLMAALSAVVPLAVAFKLVTILGSLLLPPCAYLCLRLLGVPFPGPALGAISTLFFLFMEANSMWGGNIPSTLAGEFTFSIGLALAVLFVGALRKTMRTGRGRMANAVLVAFMGLCHGYPLIWAGLVSLLELVTTRGWWRRVGTLVTIHGVAILLMAFWLIQLFWYAPYSTAFNPTWILRSWKEVLPPILWAPAIVAVASAVLHAALSLWRREPYPRGLATLWGTIFISLFFYATASSFHVVVDVRFMPFLQLVLCLAAAAGLGRLLAALPGPEIWPIAGALATLPFVQSQVSFIPGWINWNYSGFEKKGPWPVLRDINRHLQGDSRLKDNFRAPRVVYEHSPSTESLGTVRAFEDLPLFSGRSTLEGLYMQSSATTPFVFYLQSEISETISCPLPAWACTRIDLDHGLDHLRMFNVSQFIVRSAEIKKKAALHPGLVHEVTVGQYDIYRVEGNDGRYAIPLDTAPSVVQTRTWKETAYRWFKHARPGDPVPVFAANVSDEERRGFAGVFAELPRELPREPLRDRPVLEEDLETDRITVAGCRPGHPILIRISYHPRWKALTGERVWHAAPNFMLVFPEGQRVELVFGAGPALILGRVFTAMGCLILFGAILPVGRRVGARGVELLAAAPLVSTVLGFVHRTKDWPELTRRTVLGVTLALVAAVLATFVAVSSGTDADSVYREGQKIYAAERLRDALPYFREAYRLSPLSATAIHARYFEAIIHFREREWEEAEKLFQDLIETFPEARNAPEALYHIGLCRAQLGNVAGAVEAWEETARRFPDVNWAGFARERLKEVR